MGALRIVSILTTSERGGAEYANVDLLDALAARGQEVLLLTNVADIVAGTRVPALRIDLGPKLNRRTVPRSLIAAPSMLLRIVRALRAQRPVGVLLVHFKKEQLLCSLLPRSLTGRIVWMEWGPVPPPMRHGPARWLYTAASRRACRIIAISEGTRRTIIDAGVPKEKVCVVPNLLDVHEVSFDAAARERLRAQWGADQDTFVIGCISRLQRRKRNDVVIEAMSRLDRRCLLVIAGEGEQEGALRSLAEPYGDRVRFLPTVRGHVEEFLSACDVLVFAPSPTEGAPRVIVMAQLVGLPVVATDSEGAEGLIAQNAGMILTPSHDPQALAAALAGYQQDPERRRREGALARAATLQSHDPDHTLNAFEAAVGLHMKPHRG